MDVICLGIFVADVMAKPIEEMPERGKLKLFDKMELHTGGCANNTGIGLAKLGIKTACIGKVGNDGFGDFILQILKKNKIDIKGMRRDNKNNTSFTFVMIHSDGERSFFHCLGTNATFDYEDIDFNIIKKSKLLHIAGSYLMPKFDGEPTLKLLKKEKEYGIKTSLDTAWNSKGDWKKILPVLPYVDIFLPSFEEAKMIAEKDEPDVVADYFLQHGVKIAGLKMGEKGCYVKTEKETEIVPIYKVNTIDTTGAGDAFVAGFLAGIIKGYELKKCAQLANAVGACCVQAIGCTAGIKNIEETLKLVKENE